MRVRLAALVLLAGVGAGAAGSAAAGDLRLAIRNGRVNLTADQVPARQILAEWARVGQTRIVNGDRVTGPPLTLQLTDVPEREALDIILRAASGYMAVARPGGNIALSMFDRILVMPSSSGASLAQAPPAPPRMPNAPDMPPPIDPALQPADEDEGAPSDQSQEGSPNQNAPGVVGPGNRYGRVGFPSVFPGPNRPLGNPNNVNIPALTTDDTPAPGAGETMPANPWNIPTGSSLPGVISQPQPANPASPNPPQGSH